MSSESGSITVKSVSGSHFCSANGEIFETEVEIFSDEELIDKVFKNNEVTEFIETKKATQKYIKI